MYQILITTIFLLVACKNYKNQPQTPEVQTKDRSKFQFADNNLTKDTLILYENLKNFDQSKFLLGFHELEPGLELREFVGADSASFEVMIPEDTSLPLYAVDANQAWLLDSVMQPIEPESFRIDYCDRVKRVCDRQSVLTCTFSDVNRSWTIQGDFY